MRLGHLEKLILSNILWMKEGLLKYDPFPPEFKYRRFRWFKDSIPLLNIRNRLFGVNYITPANKASFSRSLRTLEKKGLIKARNGISGTDNYRTHVWLTDEGEEKAKTLLNVNFRVSPGKVNVSTHACGE